VIERALAAAEEADDCADHKFPGVATARVINFADPLMLGRIQVQLENIDALDPEPWARLATLMAGPLHGTYFIPNLFDRVLVAFEHGDLKAPYIIGSLWTAMAPPPIPTPIPQVRTIRTLVGNQIVITEGPPSITIQTAPTAPGPAPTPPSPVGPHQTIQLSPAGVVIAGTPAVTVLVGGAQVQVAAAAISLRVGSSTITMTPDGIKMTGGTVSIAAGAVTVRGGSVRINS
jgi:hypothetical protein